MSEAEASARTVLIPDPAGRRLGGEATLRKNQHALPVCHLLTEGRRGEVLGRGLISFPLNCKLHSVT